MGVWTVPDDETLRIEPGAAERIARAFEKHADNLIRIAEKLRNASHSTGFAGFPSAVELDAGFRNKALRAVAHLQGQATMARGYAADIRAAGATYAETEIANFETIRTVGYEAVPGPVDR